MSATTDRPGPSRRLSAVAALLLVAVVAVATLVRVVDDPVRVLAELIMLAVLAWAGWTALTRTGSRRTIAAVTAVVLVVALLVSIVTAEGSLGVSLLVRIAAVALAAALGKQALGHTGEALKASDTPGTPVPVATRGVLFMNLKSGGGKADRFHLVDECRRRGIEPV